MMSSSTRARVLTGFLAAMALPMFARGCARVIRHLPGVHHTVSAHLLPGTPGSREHATGAPATK
jgi:hypothetical protein